MCYPKGYGFLSGLAGPSRFTLSLHSLDIPLTRESIWVLLDKGALSCWLYFAKTSPTLSPMSKNDACLQYTCSVNMDDLQTS